MAAITHELKIYKEYADAIIRGDKTFEIRLDDRRYAIGDIIKFTEVSDGRPIGDHPIMHRQYKITYLLRNWGIKDDWIAFSIKDVTGENDLYTQVVTKEVIADETDN